VDILYVDQCYKWARLSKPTQNIVSLYRQTHCWWRSLQMSPTSWWYHLDMFTLSITRWYWGSVNLAVSGWNIIIALDVMPTVSVALFSQVTILSRRPIRSSNPIPDNLILGALVFWSSSRAYLVSYLVLCVWFGLKAHVFQIHLQVEVVGLHKDVINEFKG